MLQPASLQMSARIGEGAKYLLATVLVCGSLYFGWAIRDDYVIDAERGLGYALGIVGGSAMLLLLLYPVRKRLARTPWLVLSTPNWFRLHMMLGVVGPICILYHCNFSLGSINSNVALSCMLLMVSSGLIGRYIYSRLHMGLYGKRMELKQLQTMRTEVFDNLKQVETSTSGIREKLLASLEALDQLTRSSGPSLAGIRRTRKHSTAVREQMGALLKAETASSEISSFQFKQMKQFAESYLSLTTKIVSLAYWDRTFALWHMLHMPIFIMLIISGFVHVYAVHTY